jgi:hypothetical protein
MNVWLVLGALGCVVVLPVVILALGRAAAAEPPPAPRRNEAKDGTT